ncbi:hypothetical protein chiPu_0020726 [Chiloscyllium punctatum]|uniref:Uncharacterized protein n=1 Tax=Chiloscyllium punctatum TaxID=137246 RepID=A0A401RJ03_CHIPU|nr:hypothetical protein [Chiloscyllium punctatum]
MIEKSHLVYSSYGLVHVSGNSSVRPRRLAQPRPLLHSQSLGSHLIVQLLAAPWHQSPTQRGTVTGQRSARRPGNAVGGEARDGNMCSLHEQSPRANPTAEMAGRPRG